MAQLRTPQEPAPPDVIASIRALLDAKGEVEATKQLGVSRQSFARLLAGLSVHKGTVAAAKQGLRTYDAS